MYVTRFYEYMTSPGADRLTISVLSNDGVTDVESFYPESGTTVWRRHVVDLNPVLGAFQVILTGVLKSDAQGVIAVDDISFSEGNFIAVSIELCNMMIDITSKWGNLHKMMFVSKRERL